MAVELTKTTESFSGTGALATYTPGIYAQTADQIIVTVDGIVTGSYVLNGLRDVAGISIDGTFANGADVTITRITAKKQHVDTLNQSTILEDVFDDAIDKSMMIDQELAESVSDLEERAVRVPVGEMIAELPPPNDRKGTIFGFSLPTGVRELLTYANLSTLLAPFLTPLLAAINKGDPGGNIMAIGLFLAGGSINVPIGTNIVRTSGYSVDGKGGALYQYDATVDAAYVIAHPRSAFISTNGRGFKLSLDQQLNFYMFGAIGDDAANDGAAFVYAIAFSSDNAIYGTVFPPKGGPSLFAPLGKFYLGAQVLDITHTVDIFGEGSVGPFGGAASQLRWDAGSHGFRFQSSNTAGDSATGPQAYQGATGARLRNFYLRGGYAGVEGEFHGVYSRATIHVENVFADNFEGDGFAFISHDTGGSTNCSTGKRLYARRCRDGLRTDGFNSQGGGFEIFATENRRWAVNESSFLGNWYSGLAENNGKTPGATPCYVAYNHNWYAVVVGQEAGAATNPPSGTTADNTWWYFMNAGEVSAPNNVPAWFNGIAVRAGGAFRTDDPNAAGNVLLGFYAEPFQGPMQLTPPTLVLSGQNLGAGVKGVSPLRHTSAGLQTQQMQILNALIGPTNGDPVGIDGATYFGSTSVQHLLSFLTWSGGVPTINAEIRGKLGAGLFLSGYPKVQFYVDDPSVPILAAEVNEEGIDVPNDTPGVSGYYVGGLRVLGARAAAIGNPAVIGAAPTQADHNALAAVVVSILDVMRADGKIAP